MFADVMKLADHQKEWYQLVLHHLQTQKPLSIQLPRQQIKRLATADLATVQKIVTQVTAAVIIKVGVDNKPPSGAHGNVDYWYGHLAFNQRVRVRSPAFLPRASGKIPDGYKSKWLDCQQ